ncbi:hypothetical protein [Lactiplantibacillus modestisalitolerans]|uniref:Prophage protein n=1 Tax=Lactiplantibacillus modestisalitolerans TaxID=1457219 RepID=A0ABV5WV80_9LACO|nr:hypothetical protein [Lactiplantibacillus modestisalitolerans]
MSETTLIIYNQPKQQLLNLPATQAALTNADLTTIGLGAAVDLSQTATDESFALVYDGSTWRSQTYMEWEDLRINEALVAVKANYSEATQKVLTRFVASMDVKYQGKKSWVELLTELGQEIEG